MTKILLVSQDKGGTAKTLISRGLAEVVPGAPVLEIDSSPRMLELGKRVKFFRMRADRDEIERTGGTISRAEFDPVINAIASATLPTIVDIGANTGASLLSVIGGLADDYSAAGVQFGLLVVTTAEPGAVAEVPKLFALAAPWASARFLVDNRFHGEIDSKIPLKIAAGARVPDFRYRQTTATLDVHGFAFRAAGRQPIDLGWRAAFPDWQPTDEKGDDAQMLPPLAGLRRLCRLRRERTQSRSRRGSGVFAIGAVCSRVA